MKPFMRLAETIGAMQAQLNASPVKKITVKTFGGRDANITSKQARELLEAKVSYENPATSPSLALIPHPQCAVCIHAATATTVHIITYHRMCVSLLTYASFTSHHPHPSTSS
jgi:hypothetical protein